MSDTKDQVIVVEHFQRFDGRNTHGTVILGLYKYFNDKSLRHVYQHYIDVARKVWTSEYDERARGFMIKFSEDEMLISQTRPLREVTSLPLAPFLPRSEVEAQKMARESEVALSKK